MGGGGSEKVEDWPEPRVATVRIVDAPVLFFVATHKALRADLASIRRVAAEAAESGARGRELVVDLRRRLEFLNLVYIYHSAAEDEVIFLAIDAQIKNVVPAYSLEHKSIDENFSSIFHHLDLLTKKDEEAPQMFQELLFSIGTIQSLICHHMQKEEEQVFPILMEKFTPKEQSQLVWQYMCSVPFMLLEDFFPWTAHHLSSNEKLDLAHCIKLIMPGEILLQEVALTWIHCEERCSDTDHAYQGYQLLNGLSSLKDLHSVFPFHVHCEQEDQVKKEVQIMDDYPWHACIRRDFDQIIEEMHQIKSSGCFPSLPSTLVQLKFFADVLIFYSNYLNKVLYPLLNLLWKDSPFPCLPLIEEFQINDLQRLFFCEYQSSSPQSFVENIYESLKSLEKQLSKNLMFLEVEAFPFISKSCTSEMQLWLLCTGLRMMPLGLLRCTVTWFSAHLTEKQSLSIVNKLKLGCPSINNSFTSLIYEWVRVGCSGKTSVEKFRQNLEEMFNGRSFYLGERKIPNGAFSGQIYEPNSATNTQKPAVMPSSSSVFVTTEEQGISYPSGMNLHILFSQMYRRMPLLQKSTSESHHNTVLNLESRPMDIIFYFHRALIKDMEYLVGLSADLAANADFLAEFQKRFKFLHIIYQIHSDSEDEIAFPAMESKGALQNISHSYCIDHKLESRHFRIISIILKAISELHDCEGGKQTRQKHYQLCLELHDACLSMHKVLSDHIYREEVDIFLQLRGCFSTEEEEKIVGHMLGRTTAEILQEMIPWLMAYLTPDEQHSVMSLWLKVARYTKFDEWLREWWEGMARYNTSTPAEGSRTYAFSDADPLEIVSTYLQDDGTPTLGDLKNSGPCNVDTRRGQDECPSQDLNQYENEVDKKRSNEANERHDDEKEQDGEAYQKLSHQQHPLGINQEVLEATIRRVSRDSSLDGQKKSCIIQNLLMSRWIMTQKKSDQETFVAEQEGDIPGQSPSYQDPLKVTYGCKHYKRNCKLLFPCCKKLYTCIRCHDDLTDHSADRTAITKMMCMQCLVIQSIGPVCTKETCRGFSMGGYYCKICKLFDTNRQIYHCPYCNLCRVGKGLGIDYFHCMTCNACMSRSLFEHVCREKCLEDNCPICHEYIFTSNSPVKSLPCGHLMHSACFQEYTCSHYTCPICCKTLGDMQVYFGMLDALLAEEKIPEEYSGQTQAILCNDCEKRGVARFHWLYHKCPYCGSYNTRLL